MGTKKRRYCLNCNYKLTTQKGNYCDGICEAELSDKAKRSVNEEIRAGARDPYDHYPEVEDYL